MPALQEGQRPLVVAHANSLRSLIKKVHTLTWFVLKIGGPPRAPPPRASQPTTPPLTNIKHEKTQLDGISDEGIEALKIPNGVPFVYRFDADMQVIGRPDAVGFRCVRRYFPCIRVRERGCVCFS